MLQRFCAHLENVRVSLKSIVFGYNTLRSLAELLRSPKKLCVWSQKFFVPLEKFFALPWEHLKKNRSKKLKLKKSHWKICIQLQQFWAFPRNFAFGHKNVVHPWETLCSLTILLLFSEKFLVWSQNVSTSLQTFESGHKTLAPEWETVCSGTKHLHSLENFCVTPRNFVWSQRFCIQIGQILPSPEKLCVW